MRVPLRVQVAILLVVASGAWLLIRPRGASPVESIEERRADPLDVEPPVPLGTPPTKIGSDPQGTEPQSDGAAPTAPAIGVGTDERRTAVEGDEATTRLLPGKIAALQELAPKDAEDARYFAEVQVRARDAPDGADGLRYDVWVSASGHDVGFSGRQGRLDLAVLSDAKVVDLTVDISARGFASVRRTVRVDEARPRVRLDVELERVATGLVAVRAVSPPAGLLDRPFDVEVWDLLTRRRISRERVPTAVGGIWRFELPDGRHRIRLRPADGSIAVVAFEADLAVVAGRTAECEWVVPPCGTLQWVVPASWANGKVGVTPAEGGTASRVEARDVVHRHVPVGAYRIRPIEAPEIEGLLVTVVAER